MYKLVIALFLSLLMSVTAVASDGVISVKSSHSVALTADRLEQALKKKGMRVFIRIDHAGGAREHGMTLPPTELVIFGNPKVGTPLMQCAALAAIDLPQKALIWEDENGQVWLSYNDPKYLAKRHSIQGCDAVIAKVEKALAGFSRKATEE